MRGATRFGWGPVSTLRRATCAPPPPTWGGDRGGGSMKRPTCAPLPPTWGRDRAGGLGKRRQQMPRQLTPLGRALAVAAGLSLVGYGLHRYGLLEKLIP